MWYANPSFFRLYELRFVEGTLPSMEEEEDWNREYYVVNRAALKELGYDSCQGATLMYEDDKMRAQTRKRILLWRSSTIIMTDILVRVCIRWYLWCDVALPVTCIRCHTVRAVLLR